MGLDDPKTFPNTPKTTSSLEDVFHALTASNEINFTVTDPKGLHWKPCNQIVEAVKDLDCIVIFTVDGRGIRSAKPNVAHGDSIMELISLCVEDGGQVKVRVTGNDSPKAITNLLSCVHWYPSDYKELWAGEVS